MDSFIICGGKISDREALIKEMLIDWKTGKFATINISPVDGTIGIKQIRDLISQISLKPIQSEFTVCLIRQAESLSLEAEQSLLKTLEEPPKHAKIILETQNIATLLPTILSRCQIINIRESGEKAAEIDLSFIISNLTKLTAPTKPGEKLKIIDGITSNRDAAINFTDAAISLLEAELHQKNRQFNLSIFKINSLLKKLLLAREKLNGYINPKLVLDHVFSEI